MKSLNHGWAISLMVTVFFMTFWLLSEAGWILNNETRTLIIRRPGFFSEILLLVFFLTINRYNIISDVYFQKQD